MKLKLHDYSEHSKYVFKNSWLYKYLVLNCKHKIDDKLTNLIYICER